MGHFNDASISPDGIVKLCEFVYVCIGEEWVRGSFETQFTKESSLKATFGLSRKLETSVSTGDLVKSGICEDADKIIPSRGKYSDVYWKVVKIEERDLVGAKFLTLHCNFHEIKAKAHPFKIIRKIDTVTFTIVDTAKKGEDRAIINREVVHCNGRLRYEQAIQYLAQSDQQDLVIGLISVGELPTARKTLKKVFSPNGAAENLEFSVSRENLWSCMVFNETGENAD